MGGATLSPAGTSGGEEEPYVAQRRQPSSPRGDSVPTHEEPGQTKKQRHWIKNTLGYGTAGVAGAAAGPVAASTGLGALGFSSVGPVGGSYAASVMSTAGAIKAGSWFAFAQSAAMGGTALVTLPATVATAGTGLAMYSQRKHIYKGVGWVYNKCRL